MSLKFDLQDYLILDGILDPPDDKSNNEQNEKVKKESARKEKRAAREKYLDEKKTNFRKTE